MKKLILITASLSALLLAGCSSGQDVGDANKDPAPGTAAAPASPGAAAGGSAPAGGPTAAAPQTPQ